DPSTTTPNPDFDQGLPVSPSNLQYTRSVFPGNLIPENRLAPSIQEALSLYPLPNTNSGPFCQNNYFVNAPQTDTADGVIAKLDLPFGEQHRITFVNTISDGFLGPAKYFPNTASP